MQGFQRFYNYYAYDDGTPEESYGLSPKGSQLAYRFYLNKSPDTLRAVRFFFNKTLSNSSQQFFNLCVWDDNAGYPGDTLYVDLVMPKYADSLNKFVTYHLNPPIPVTGIFYVGWKQTTDDNLCVGFDRANNSQSEIFYNVSGPWVKSAYAGSLLIRPVVGKPIPLGSGDIVSTDRRLVLYPNPCTSGTLHVRIPGISGESMEPAKGTIAIYDLTGRRRLFTSLQESIDVSNLPGGFYFAEVKGQSGIRTRISKFIISR
jgi:hypothetical protein